MPAKVTSTTVDLEYPVTVDGTEYKSLTFRRMKAKDALSGEGETSEARAGFALFATLADVDIAVIEELDIEDLATIGEKVAPMMGKRGEALLNRLQQGGEANGDTAGAT